MFGPINKWIGKGTLYLGIIFFIISNLLIATSNGNMAFLLTGLFLSSITGSWCFPFIFSNLDKLTTKNTINFATSLIFIGCNIGNFIAPISMQLAQFITRSTSLTAPFFVFAGVFMTVLLVMFFAPKKKTTSIITN